MEYNITDQPSCDENKTCITKDHVIWIVVDVMIIFLTLSGNILTICAIKLSRKINELLSNKYIFNLAVSDLMVGLTIPYHMSFTIWGTLGSQKLSCVIRFVLIILACSSSIYNLLAIAADRYIAIVLPFHYSRHMCKSIVWGILSGGWLISIVIGTAPFYWNTWVEGSHCTMSAVLPTDYVNFILTPMFLSIWLAMSMLYFRIWREARGHSKRLQSATQLHRHKQKKTLRENKSVQMVLVILGCFSICWLPYFVIITYMRCFTTIQFELWYEVAFTMAITNSCLNPVIYAWKSKNYRRAFWCMLRCSSPRSLNQEDNFITDHVPCGKSKKDSMVLDNMETTITTIELHDVHRKKQAGHEDSGDTVATYLD